MVDPGFGTELMIITVKNFFKIYFYFKFYNIVSAKEKRFLFRY